ncbi:hypothetical protein GZH82_06795 [Staphylococcus ursi]|uniref:hypothetical protein n=1 Tax=Staphylococcus sp. MI 10-1553 TaxID=1912064 RepID=UPI0013975D9D|nr:hypothetical protein [Staphylococcus sp. MI 10-1553]QHW37051.1 hypothetical protein GZH82_06795 [Staphylococcus sp. MI 10-1553]
MKNIEYEIAELELKKFFSLVDNDQMYYMPRCVVDKVWHEKLENEEEYKEFCRKYSEAYIQHKENKGEGILPWVPKYENKFGKLSPAWFTNEEGNVNTEIYDKYIKEGDIRVEWDCAPISTTD